MATCKDCLHYDVCQNHIDEETKMTVAECSYGFKNKSDYVEVEWIDVNDRLPERDGETVLCYVRNSSTGGETCVVGCIQQRKHWFLQTCNIGIATFPNHYWKVTHWMPLPKPPETTKGGER